MGPAGLLENSAQTSRLTRGSGLHQLVRRTSKGIPESLRTLLLKILYEDGRVIHMFRNPSVQ